jgi:hypothetical protein
MIILSCGHREDDFDKHKNVMIKEWTINEDGWMKAVAYKCVCLHCFLEYEKDGLILYTDEEAMEWIKS